MTTTFGFFEGIAQLLQQKLGASDTVLYSLAPRAYNENNVGVYYRVVPDHAFGYISISPYDVSDSPNLSTGTLGVQIRTRGKGVANPAATDDLADKIFGVLHGATNVVLPNGAQVVQILRQSSVSLGVDPTGRWERSDNYYLTTYRPTPNRT